MGRLARLTRSDREEILSWLRSHPETVHGEEPESLVVRAERAIRRRAGEDAWREARAYLEERMRGWERGWGFHASDAYVALEVCPLLARALRLHERHLHEGDEEHLIGRPLLEHLDPEARERIRQWALELGEDEHHRVWEDIVRYTRRRGRDLVKSGIAPRDLDWDATENFAAKAALIAGILAAEFEARARGTGMP